MAEKGGDEMKKRKKPIFVAAWVDSQTEWLLKAVTPLCGGNQSEALRQALRKGATMMLKEAIESKQKGETNDENNKQ